MASLEEKKMLGNPLLVSLSCNNPFATLNGTVTPEAFLRRKEHLWKVSLKRNLKKWSEATPEEQANFDMYEFQQYDDPADPNSLQPEIYSYEQWRVLVEEDCKKYHEREKINVQKRLDSLRVLLPENARQMMHEVDPFKIFYAAYVGAADQDGLIQSGLLPSELIETQLREFVNMPVNGAGINSELTPVPREEMPSTSTSTPREEEPNSDQLPTADAHIDLTNIPNRMMQWIKDICYVDDPNGPVLRPELYIATDRCNICMDEDVQVTHGCSSGHKICSACQEGMANNIATTPYRCGVCRGALFALNEVPIAATQKLRLLVWYQYAKEKALNNYQYASNKIMDLRWWLAHHQWAQSCLSFALFILYLSGISYVRARLDLRQFGREDDGMNEWREADEPHALSLMHNWGPFFYTRRHWLRRREFRERTAILDGWGTGPERDELIHEYGRNANLFMGTAYRVGGRTAHAQIDPEERLTDQHAELIRFPFEDAPVHAITASSCPHIRLFRAYDDAGYEVELDGTRRWEIGIMTRDYVYAAECQYANCAWKDRNSRMAFYNRWAQCNSTYIRDQKREWERVHGVFPLPLEFVSAEAIQVAEAQRTALYQAVESFRSKTWWEFCSEKWQKYGKFVKLASAIATGIATFIGAFKLFSLFKPAEAITAGAQLVNSGAYHTRRLQRTMITPRQLVGNAQISPDVEARAVRMVEKNTIFLVVKYTRGNVNCVKRLRGIGLFGRTYAIPRHYAQFILYHLAIFEKGEITNFKVSLERFIHRECATELDIQKNTFRLTSNDLAFGVTPPEFPMFKDITNAIPTVEQHTHIGGAHLTVECEPEAQRITATPGTIYGTVDKLKIKATTFWEGYEAFDVYYTSYGKPGTCGSILVADTNTPLFGMHVAGYNDNPLNSTGFAVPLIREDIEELKKGTAVLSYWYPKLEDPADAHMQLSGAIMPVGGVKKNMIAFMPKKTKIVPSLLQGEIYDGEEKIPVVTQPGILSPHDERYTHDLSPLYHGCMKHTRPPLRFNQDRLDYCVDQISAELNEKLIPMRNLHQKLTLEESITGFNDLEYYDCIDLQTSAGWPWNCNEKKTKKDFIIVERDKNSKITKCEIDKGLLQVLHRNDDLREQGIRPFTVFLDWLKDERRKEKKLALKDGTRIFSLSPVDFTIQLRQETIDFSASFMKYREQTESAVGIVVDGHEWSRLANNLLAKSSHIVTGDYSDFGPRLASQVVRAAFSIIKKWFEHNEALDDLKARKLDVMCEEIANANHIMHDFIYQAMCGMPSGNSLTVILNSLANMLYIRYAWFSMFPKSTEQEFKKNVFLKVYGDDLIMSVSADIIEEFNCQTISQLFKEYDIIFTDAEKTGTTKYSDIYNSTFLKSGFLKHPDYELEWLSCLDKISIFECAQWVWKSYDLTRATLDNAEQSLRLAYGHGPEFFYWWRKCLNRALTRLRLKNLSLTWKHVDQQFYTGITGYYVQCSRFDDGLGLNGFAYVNDSWLKEEVREKEKKEQILDFYALGSGEVVPMTKGQRVVREREEEEE